MYLEYLRTFVLPDREIRSSTVKMDSIKRRILTILILAHRGYWKTSDERNSLGAFERSFTMGCAVEMDIRDYQGLLVISHDIADKESAYLEDLFRSYRTMNSNVLLALNIKADGLQTSLEALIKKYQITNYFVFDMSIPDMIIYLKEGFNVFIRQSEFEKELPFYDEAVGVWMDCFENDWIQIEDIKFHLDNGKKVCLVSPELHRRDHVPFWERLGLLDKQASRNVLLCTDYPEDGRRYFS